VNDSGLICFGNVQFPRCTPATIGAAAALFLESFFNDHLAAGRVAADPDGLLAFLKTLEGAASFPADQLKPAHLTVGDLVRGRAGRLDWDEDDGEDGFDDEADNPAGRFDDELEDDRDELVALQAELME
jgi:hypothetical protein